MPIFDVALWRQLPVLLATHNALVEAPYAEAAIERLMQYTQLPYVEHAAAKGEDGEVLCLDRVPLILDPYGRLAAIPFIGEVRCCRRCACRCLRCDRSCLPYVERPLPKVQPLPVCLLPGRHVVAVGDMVVYRCTYGGATHPREKGPYRGRLAEIDDMGLWVRDEDGAGLALLVLAADVLAVEPAASLSPAGQGSCAPCRK